jgi:hypothetical protein
MTTAALIAVGLLTTFGLTTAVNLMQEADARPPDCTGPLQDDRCKKWPTPKPGPDGGPGPKK